MVLGEALTLAKSLLMMIVIILCAVLLLRGKVFAIRYQYVLFLFFLFFCVTIPAEYLTPGIPNGWLYYVPIILLFLIAIFIIASVVIQSQYFLFWGIDKKAVFDLLRRIGKTKGMEFEFEADKVGLSGQTMGIIKVESFIIDTAGTFFYSKTGKNKKDDNKRMMQGLEESLNQLSLSQSSKAILFLIIIFSCFVLLASTHP